MQNFLPTVYIIIFFSLILLFDRLINFFMQRSFLNPVYRFIVAPGVIVHELSHASAVLLTFHKIKKINLFDRKGGYVVHTKTREPISQVIISFAPIIGIFAVFLVITYLLQPELLKISSTNWSDNIDTLKTIDFKQWQTWFHAYLSISLATSLAPSSQDLKVSFIGILIIILVIFLISLSSAGEFLTNTLRYSYSFAIYILAFLSIALLLSVLLYTITKLVRN